MSPSLMDGAMMGLMPGDPRGAMMGGSGGMPMGGGASPASDREPPAKSAAPRAPSAALPPGLRNISEGVRGFLETRTDMDFYDQPFVDVLAYLESVAKSEVTFVSLPGNLPAEKQPSVTVRLKQVTIASALEALSDLYGYAFVFRDYGILVIEPTNRVQIDAFRHSGASMIAPPQGTGVPMMGPESP